MFLRAGVVSCFFCLWVLVEYKVGRSLATLTQLHNGVYVSPCRLLCNLKQRYKKDF